MRTLTRWEPFRGVSSLQDHVNRLFNDVFERANQESSLTAWAPSVDIYETEHELVVKADLPEVDPKDLDIRVENNILTIRGERKFEKKADYQNGVLTLSIPKKEEAKPKQIKVNVGSPAMAASASGR